MVSVRVAYAFPLTAEGVSSRASPAGCPLRQYRRIHVAALTAKTVWPARSRGAKAQKLTEVVFNESAISIVLRISRASF